MTDDTQTPTDAAANGQATPRPTVPPIQISAQYVKDLSFENPNAPQSLMGGQQAPQVAVNVDVRTNQINENSWEVVLNIKGDAKAGDRQAFIVELSYAGIATLTGVQKEHTAPLLLIEVPRLLFPFARAVIAEATRNGGFPPLLVQPIDFADLFRRQLQTLRDRQKPAESAPAGTPG
ncbi:MAG TPA: protein-export chaperone SecB [Alphaproteobacteria bacterium]|nr:protein-export chaperone SecB [Alphaproteobacteria bacterium]